MAVQDEARVLVLYSGGTIGMLSTDRGYVPEKGYLTASLQACQLPCSNLVHSLIIILLISRGIYVLKPAFMILFVNL